MRKFKSEYTPSENRFYSVPVAMPAHWVPRLNHIAKARGINRSSLVRGAIEQTLFSSEPHGQASTTQDSAHVRG